MYITLGLFQPSFSFLFFLCNGSEVNKTNDHTAIHTKLLPRLFFFTDTAHKIFVSFEVLLHWTNKLVHFQFPEKLWHIPHKLPGSRPRAGNTARLTYTFRAPRVFKHKAIPSYMHKPLFFLPTVVTLRQCQDSADQRPMWYKVTRLQMSIKVSLNSTSPWIQAANIFVSTYIVFNFATRLQTLKMWSEKIPPFSRNHSLQNLQLSKSSSRPKLGHKNVLNQSVKVPSGWGGGCNTVCPFRDIWCLRFY